MESVLAKVHYVYERSKPVDILAAISDCEVVIALGIGPDVALELERHGLEVIHSREDDIDEIVISMPAIPCRCSTAVDANTPTGWKWNGCG